MSDDIKTLTPDEVKANVVQELGLDPEDEANKPIIEKVVAKEIEHQKNLSSAIEQKATYRKTAIEAGLIDPVTFKPIEKKEINKPNNNELTREEVILIAKGVEDADIVYLKKLQAGEKAMGNEISLTEAMSNPLFVAYKEQKEAKAKAEKAQLGASGSGAIHQDNQFKNNQPREEHKKLWEEEMKKF